MTTHTIYQDIFNEQLGASDERIKIVIEYGEDFNGDGLNDIKVTLSVDDISNSGTEDMIGVAFDIGNDSLISSLGLDISNITTDSATPTIDYTIGQNVVTGNFGVINISGGGVDTPYDAAVQFNLGGSGDGIVQEASFLITSSTTSLDTNTDPTQDLVRQILNGTDWYIRLQSTDGGSESAKTGGFILDIGDPPPNPDSPAIDIEKEVSFDGGQTWYDADTAAEALDIVEGTNVQFRIIARNTGDVELTNVVLDDNLYDLNGADPGTTVTIASLGVGDSYTHIYTTTWEAGLQTNTATATSDQGVTDTDDGNYFGANPAIAIEKVTNGADGLNILEGTPVTWTYTVNNTGNIGLSNVNVSDDQGVVVNYVSGDTDTDGILDTTETWIYEGTGTAVAGDYSNIGTVTGNYTDDLGNTENLTDDDPSSYFGADPAIAIDKVTNGADGLNILEGTPVTWTYTVNNTGNVGISNVSVTDDNGTVNDTSDDFIPTYVSGDTDSDSILDVGETWTYQGNGTAQAGDYSNIGTVTGDYTDDLGNTENLTDDDPSNYFGADPSIDVEKYVSVDGGNTFVDADNPAGPLLTEGNGDPIFKFVVQNTGNVALTGITLSDSDFALNLVPFDLAANDGVAGGADEFVYTFNGATWEAGQHTNTATVNATYTDDLGNQAPLTDSDDANYYGDALPEISVIKTASTTSIREDVGADVTYTVTITNDSDPNSADYDPVTITSLPDALWIDNNGDGIQQTTEVQTVDRLNDALADWQAAGNTGDLVLDPGEAFTFDYTISYGAGELNPWEDPKNTIIANGTDDEGNETSDEDDAVVDVFQQNQRSIEIDSLTGIRNGDILSGNFRLVNASGDPVNVKVDSLNMAYEEQVEGSKGNKKSWLPTELGYSNQFWLDNNQNGLLDSGETELTDLDSSTTDIFETAIVFGSSVYIGYKSTFDSAVPDPIRATAEATIDGRFDRFGEKVTFHYTEVL